MLTVQPRCLVVGSRVKNMMLAQPPRRLFNLPLSGALSLSKTNSCLTSGSRSNININSNSSSRYISSIISGSVSHNNSSSYNDNSKISSRNSNNNCNIICYSKSTSSNSRRSNNSTSMTSGYCRTFSRTFSDGFQSKGILGKLARLFDTSNNAANVAGAKALINIVSDHSSNPHWFTKGLVGMDFRSIHALKTLHLWIIHKRLIKESNSSSEAAAARSNRKGELIQESLFDEFWDDTIKRIRAQGVVEISVNKNLQEIQKLSFRFCLELDEALDKRFSPSEVLVMNSNNSNNNSNNNNSNSNGSSTSSSEESASTNTSTSDLKLENLSPQEVAQLKRAMEDAFRDKIGGIVWRNIFMKKSEIPADHVLKLANYVSQELDSLLNMPSDVIFQGMFEFTDVKLIFDESLNQSRDLAGGGGNNSRGGGGSKSNNGRTYVRPNQRAAKGGDSSSSSSSSSTTGATMAVTGGGEVGGGEWKAALASDGRTYYWNTVTRESRWDVPKEEGISGGGGSNNNNSNGSNSSSGSK